MTDSFKVKANKLNNKLIIQLRGYFMKSELELAFYLARKESKKLVDGYEVMLDLDGMYTTKQLFDSISTRARRMFITLGASKVKSVGVIPLAQAVKTRDIEYFALDSVGYYPN